MYTAICLAGFLLLTGMKSGGAQTPCDFMGISVGDKITPAEIMKKFDIKKYDLNQNIDILRNQEDIEFFTKYVTPTIALEVIQQKNGPGCHGDSCNIPYGVTIGSDIPAKLTFIYDKGVIRAIAVKFSSSRWSEVKKIIYQKYGTDWEVESTPIYITNLLEKTGIFLNRETLEHRTGGSNPKTNSLCEISASEYDIIFAHHDSLGLYQSIFEISLTSKNF